LSRAVIVSASYNDDIPAFYGRWFMNRIDAGYCRTFDAEGLRLHRVVLTPDAVDGFVFFTRRAAPFAAALEEVARRGFAFVVHYGITRPDEIETAVALAAAYGPRCVVWRYEPLVLSADTPPAWHISNFEALARALEGSTDEVIVSFDADAPAAESRPLVKALAVIAASRGMRLCVCSQPDVLAPGAGPARCVDARRLSARAARTIEEPTAARWAGCLCAAARDIGAPMQGPARGAALAPRAELHDPDGEFLVPPPNIAPTQNTDLPF
jgi:hypothetical protein